MLSFDARQPVLFQDGSTHQGPPRGLLKQGSPDFHGGGQVQLKPPHGAVIQAIKAGIQARADLDHRCMGMLSEMLSHQGVDDRSREQNPT